MSAESHGESVSRKHWRKTPMGSNHEEYLPLTDREFFCRECRSKCTLTTSGDEVGHLGECPHRGEHLPASRNRLSYRE